MKPLLGTDLMTGTLVHLMIELQHHRDALINEVVPAPLRRVKPGTPLHAIAREVSLTVRVPDVEELVTDMSRVVLACEWPVTVKNMLRAAVATGHLPLVKKDKDCRFYELGDLLIKESLYKGAWYLYILPPKGYVSAVYKTLNAIRKVRKLQATGSAQF